LPHYGGSNNNNGPAANATIGLTTFGHHGAALGQTTIGNAGNVADTSVLGQSISYTLSRQGGQRPSAVHYSQDDYYVSFFGVCNNCSATRDQCYDFKKSRSVEKSSVLAQSTYSQ
jgi:hypothetical protein